MFASLSVLSLASFVSQAALTCNRMEIGGFSVPEYACMVRSHNNGEIIESIEPVCDGVGQTTGYLNSYNNLDCSGDPTETKDPCYDEGSDCTYTCTTGGDPCTYAAMEQWEGVTECNGDAVVSNAFANYTKTAIIPGGECVASDGAGLMFGCSSTQLTMTYWQSTDCSGDPVISNYPFASTNCNATEGTAAAVDCNAVAPSGSSGSGTNAPTITSSDPTQNPTVSPSESPSKMPTISPVTIAPTQATEGPSMNPTQGPTTASDAPSGSPTRTPTSSPSGSPTTPTTEATGYDEDDDDDDDDFPGSGNALKVSSFMSLFVAFIYGFAN